MLAVDTNVIVRLVIRDDLPQYQKAKRVFEQNTLFLAKTVVLEIEWVLRRSYRLDKTAVTMALEATIDLPNVLVEDEPAVRQALEWHTAGMDLADALHLASCRRAERFLTFDRDMLEAGATLGLPVATP